MTTTTNLSQAGTPSPSIIQWPAAYLPARAAVFVHNEIVIPAAPGTIWRILLRAQQWPAWYPNADDVHFVSHTGPDLRDRSRFRWSTFGVRFTSKVLEFEPNRLLAWNAHAIGVDAYHVWLLTPLPDGQTQVVTEETQNGWLAALSKRLMPERKQRLHQLWLEGLSRKAQQLEAES